jgi:hypothetical protein
MESGLRGGIKLDMEIGLRGLGMETGSRSGGHGKWVETGGPEDWFKEGWAWRVDRGGVDMEGGNGDWIEDHSWVGIKSEWRRGGHGECLGERMEEGWSGRRRGVWRVYGEGETMVCGWGRGGHGERMEEDWALKADGGGVKRMEKGVWRVHGGVGMESG